MKRQVIWAGVISLCLAGGAEAAKPEHAGGMQESKGAMQELKGESTKRIKAPREDKSAMDAGRAMAKERRGEPRGEPREGRRLGNEDSRGLAAQRERKAEQVQKELERMPEDTPAREQRRKWWKFWE